MSAKVLYFIGLRQMFLLLVVSLWNVVAYAQTPHLAGKFVWAEFVTDDVKAAQRFYGGLLGWTFQEKNGYVTAFNGEMAVAGMFFHPRPPDRAAKPRWISYLSAPDLQQVSTSVLAAGGVVKVPSSQIPGLGERIIFADPEGALFGLMRLQAGDPEDYLADIGSWIWLQLLSRDVQSAADFYQAVGGYELFSSQQAGRGEEHLLVRQGYSRAAITQISPKRLEEGVTPIWFPFLRVTDVASSVSRALALGGDVLVAQDPALFDGRVAVLADSSGGVFALMEWNAEQEDGDGP